MRVVVIVCMTGCAVACGGPADFPDSDAGSEGQREAGSVCDVDICLSGRIDDRHRSFVAGWWGPTFGISEPSMTGGFTASATVSDACEEVQSMNPPPDGWSFGFLLRDRDGDADGDGLPDPGTYSIVSGWEEEHPETTFVELLVARAEGGLTLPATLTTAEGGSLTIYDVEPEGRMRGVLDATFQDSLGRVTGSFSVDYCVPVSN